MSSDHGSRRCYPGAVLGFVAVALFSCPSVLAQAPLLSQVNTVAAPSQGVPVEYTFSVTQTGTYSVTLTDFGAQQTPAAPLASVALAITTGSTIVGVPLTAAGTTQFTAASAGTYVVRVVGQPGPVIGSGPFGVVITNAATNSQLADFSGALALPPAAAPTVAVLDDSFTVTTAGTYTVTLTDLKFPQSLQTLQLALVTQGGASLLASLTAAGGQQSAPVALTTSTIYAVVAFGQSGTALNAGLYAVVVRDSAGNVAYTRTLAVGTLTALTPPAGVMIAAGGYTLTFADLAFPVALANLAQGSIVTRDDQVAASLTATGSTTFTATGGQVQVFALATPASSPGAGSYDVDLRLTAGGAPPVLSVAQAVSAAGSSTQGFTFNTAVTSAGSYTLQLVDYQIPAALTGVTLIAVQTGASVATLTSPGMANLPLATGNVSLLVFAKGAAAGGLFGMFVAPQAGGTPILETVQTTGLTLFTSSKVSVTTAGNYVATLTDLGFPAALANLYLVVTQGTSVTGWVAGGGSLPFTATPADYFVTFAAQPSATALAGTYALSVGLSTAPAPTVTLTAGASNVASGATTTLTWSTQNATACTASGGWSGTEPLSGMGNTPALSASTTFTLSCTGLGGTTNQSVTVSVTTPTPVPSGGGGGGAIDLGVLLLLSGLVLLRVRRAAVTRAAHVGLACIGVLALTACSGPAAREAWHTRRGQDYLAQGQYAKARVEFRNALQIAPSSAELRYYNGVAAEKLGNIREAAQFYYGAVDVNKDYTPARVNLARLLVFAGLPDEALKQLAPGLAAHRDDVGLLTVRAAALQEKKDPAALAEAQRAVALDPKNEEAVATLAGIEMRGGEAASAQSLIEDALRRLPTSVQLRGVLAQLYLDRGNLSGAEAQLLELVRLKPGERRYRIQLAQLYSKTDRLDDAERTLREAITALPDDEDTKTSLVQFLWARRGHAVAEAELKRMMAQAPKDVELRFTLADLYLQGGSTPKAEAIFHDLIRDQRTDAYGLRARDRLAAILVARNDEADAQKLVKEVLQENPADAEALGMRASDELRRGETEAAIADLRRVLRDTPNAVNLLEELAGAYLADGDPQLAEDAARRAVATDPSNVTARVELARVLLQGSKFEEGRTIVDELHQQRPDDVNVVDLLYRVSIAQHDDASARSAASELISLRPEWGLGQLYLGIVQESVGQNVEALANFRRALELQPRTVEPLKALVGLFERIKRYDEAVRLLDEVSQRYPTDAVAPALKGDVLLAQGSAHLGESERAYRVALSRTPTWWTPYRGLVYVEVGRSNRDAAAALLHEAAGRVKFSESERMELASLLSRTGQEEDAIKQYEAILQRNPKSTVAAASLALLLVSYRTDDVSLSRAATLVRPLASSSDWQLLDAFGWVEFKSANLATALAALEKAAALRPDASLLRFHLGMVELKAGNAASAEKDLAAAVAKDTPFFGRNEAKAVLAGLRSRKS